MKKTISILLALVFAFSVVSTAVAERNIRFECRSNDGIEQLEIMREIEKIESTMGIGSDVAVFFAGILVGYVIDGIFTYVTGGQSIAQFTSAQISRVVSYVRSHFVTKVHVSSSGYIHGGGGGKF